MLQTKQPIFVAVNPIDFRKGMDAIINFCRQQLHENVKSGCWFLFRNRQRRAIKLLVYDGQGFWLCQKRLSSGTFKQWPSSSQDVLAIRPEQVHVLLYNGDPNLVQLAPVWRSLPT